MKSVDFHDQDSKLIFLAVLRERPERDARKKMRKFGEVSGQIMGSEMLPNLSFATLP